MFTQLYHLLRQDEFYNISFDIEILKGLGEKPKNLRERLKKNKRRYNILINLKTPYNG